MIYHPNNLLILLSQMWVVALCGMSGQIFKLSSSDQQFLLSLILDFFQDNKDILLESLIEKKGFLKNFSDTPAEQASSRSHFTKNLDLG